MPRLSTRGLMAFVVLMGVGLAALKNANDIWAGIMLLTALAAVGAAVLGTVILRGSEQAWWAGFAFFTGGYLILTVIPLPSHSMEPLFGTTFLLEYAHERIAPSKLADWDEADLRALQTLRGSLTNQIEQAKAVSRAKNDPALQAVTKQLAAIDSQLRTRAFDRSFKLVGHSIFALLAGLLGGQIAARFHARRLRAEAAGWLG